MGNSGLKFFQNITQKGASNDDIIFEDAFE